MIKVLPKLPFWAVKKAYRSITLYHFAKQYESREPDGLASLQADRVVVVSFKDKITGYVHDVKGGDYRVGASAKQWDNAKQAMAVYPTKVYVDSTYSTSTMKGRKWDLYWGKDFVPDKDLHKTVANNPAIYQHIIDTLFTKKEWLVMKK